MYKVCIGTIRETTKTSYTATTMCKNPQKIIALSINLFNRAKEKKKEQRNNKCKQQV